LRRDLLGNDHSEPRCHLSQKLQETRRPFLDDASLEATLTEEKNTDKTLTGVAKQVVNVEAENEGEEEDA
jgi:hypothetical protein